ncbi:MAG: hypothetical protein GC145_17660 [Caulobacter sp.]|nr:hypothetical protein [Caulobacter sp.]
MAVTSLFATRLYRAELPAERGGEGLIGDLADDCAMMAAEDAAGRAWSKANRYPGYTSYSSPGPLWTRTSGFGALKTRLDRHAKAFAEDLGLDLAGGKLRLDNLWVNVLKPGGGHSSHIHPHSVISGTVYVTIPEGTSGLKLEDPRLAMMMAAPMRRPEAPADQQPFVFVTPTAGTLLMWESWLRHEVPANPAKTERVSVSFNYGWR